MEQWILDAPIVSAVAMFYMRAFYDLSTCRPLGFGCIGPIPWLAIVEYADRAELEPDVKRAFVIVIRQMDSGAYLPWQAKEAERKGKK